MKTNKDSGTFVVKGSVWLYPGASANWHFFTIPKKESSVIKKEYGARAKGWGSLPVTVTLGETVWTTSIFPDGKSGRYLLPLKAAIRKKEGVYEGDRITLTFSVTL